MPTFLQTDAGAAMLAAPAEARKRSLARKAIGHVLDVAVWLLIMGGIVLVTYPMICDLWIRAQMQSVGADYDSVVIADAERQAVLSHARDYNDRILDEGGGVLHLDAFMQQLQDAVEYNSALEEGQMDLTVSPEDYDALEEYESLLNPMGNSIMAYIVVPDLNIDLPIYHGTSNAALSEGAGHVIGSSLPVGGVGTHSVIAAHSGLPSARMFDSLEGASEGMLMFVDVLGEHLAYKVSDIRTVLPTEVDSLRIDRGKDEITLVTCVPYGVNTHRLLVTGERTEVGEDEMAEIFDEVDETPWWLYFALSLSAIVVCGAVLGFQIHISHKPRKKKKSMLESAGEGQFGSGEGS